MIMSLWVCQLHFPEVEADVSIKKQPPQKAPKTSFFWHPKKLLTKSNSEAFAANRNAVVREVLRAKAWEGLKSKEGLQWSVCVCVFVNQRLNKLIDDDILYDYLCDNCALFDSCDTYMKSYEYDDD